MVAVAAATLATAKPSPITTATAVGHCVSVIVDLVLSTTTGCAAGGRILVVLARKSLHRLRDDQVLLLPLPPPSFPLLSLSPWPRSPGGG
jgi:hypothetical protein